MAAPPTQSRSLARARRSRIYLATVLDNGAAGSSASHPCYPFLTPLKWRSPWHPRAVRAPLPCAAARLLGPRSPGLFTQSPTPCPQAFYGAEIDAALAAWCLRTGGP